MYYCVFQKVEREKKKELISESGGWCIHDAKELGEGGFHATDHKLAAALAEFFRGIFAFKISSRGFPWSREGTQENCRHRSADGLLHQ